MSTNEGKQETVANEAEEQPKKKHSARRIRVQVDNLQAVAMAAKNRLVADGMSETEAKKRINAVWEQFKGREYTYTEHDQIHALVSPEKYLTGALYSMAQYESTHATQDEYRKACRRDCELIAELNVLARWGTTEAIYNPEVDYICGQIAEARRRIRRYLDTYKD